MKIFNIKLDIHKIRYIFIFLIILLLTIFLFSIIINTKTIIMTNTNYTKILKDSHANISKYVGRNIQTTGYIFRAKDFEEDQFVVARDMLINEKEANIVGFLCKYDKASDFEDNIWVEIYGTIFLGDYYGAIPIIKVGTIKRITTPENIFVYPPKD